MADQSELKKMYRTRNEGSFPDKLVLNLEKEEDLRYGENPNQPGALYTLGGSSLAAFTNIRLVKTGKSGLSATNVMDVTRALEILKYFDTPAVAVMKHLIPSGFATTYEDEDLAGVYAAARDADARSAFGSVVVFNRAVDSDTAKEIASSFVEGVAAPDFDEDAVELLSEKKNLRLIQFDNLDKLPKFPGDSVRGLYDLKALPSGRVLVQEPYLTAVKSGKDLVLQPTVTNKDGEEAAVARSPSEQEVRDLLTAWYINLGVRSNGIVIVKDGVSLAIGSGQQERVGAAEQALLKAYQKALDRAGVEYDSMDVMQTVKTLKKNPLTGAVMSSDGFFPFRDNIDLVAAHGISAVVQPGGSVKDYEVIQAVNEHEMAMAFTGQRCFGHF